MHYKIIIASFLALTSMTPFPAAATGIKEAKAAAYARAKETMPADLYVIYRIAERIMLANQISRPIRVAVRRNVDCSGFLDESKCQAAQLLPDIDKSTNFDIWAAQVVGTMRGRPNAAASSSAGMLFVNTALLKEVMGRPNQLACVVAHEIAHITQNHQEETTKKRAEVDKKTARKISSAVKNAHNAQSGARTTALILGGLAAGLGDSSALQQTQISIAYQNLSASLIAPEIANQALSYSRPIGESFNEMQGLAPSYVKRTFRDIENYLRDNTLELMGFSRKLEYEADLLGLDYIARSGFNPKACVKLWTETMPHDQDKLIKRLLPEGFEDPVSKKQEGAGLTLEQIQKQAYEASIKGTNLDPEKKNSDNQGAIDSDPVPDEVMEALMSTHPRNLDRAQAIQERLNDRATISRLVRDGQPKINSIFIRNWSYDEMSDSVVISGEPVRPENAGKAKNGMSGIDIDKQLGF